MFTVVSLTSDPPCVKMLTCSDWILLELDIKVNYYHSTETDITFKESSTDQFH